MMLKIMNNYWKFLILPILFILVGVVILATSGFETDIDFSGGTMMQIDMERALSIEDQEQIESTIESVTGVEVYSVQKVGGDSQIIIKMGSIDADKRIEVFETLKEKYALAAEQPLASENISPQISQEIIYNALLAVVIASVLMMIYIAIRFELLSGIAAISAVVFDVLIMLSAYAVFRIPVNASFIAAILTIIGYSVNDTIIIFDRIRENLRFSKKEDFAKVCEKSIWQSLRRTLNTTSTTAIALIVLFVFGTESIREFALPLIIGVISGAFSTIFIASPMWNLMRKDKNAVKGKKVKTA